MIYLFLSHSWKDKEFVRKLDQSLQFHGIPTFLDERDIKVGDSIPRKIVEAIERSSHLVYVISTHSVQSPWVTEELDVAQVRQKEREGYKILPLRIDDIDVPAGVRHLRWADFRNWQLVERYFMSLKDLLTAVGYKLLIPSGNETHFILSADADFDSALKSTLLAYHMSDLAIDTGLEFSRFDDESLEASMRLCWHRLRDAKYPTSMTAFVERLNEFRDHESDRLRELRQLCLDLIELYVSKRPSGANVAAKGAREAYILFRELNNRVSRILFAIVAENRKLLSAGLPDQKIV